MELRRLKQEARNKHAVTVIWAYWQGTKVFPSSRSLSLSQLSQLSHHPRVGLPCPVRPILTMKLSYRVAPPLNEPRSEPPPWFMDHTTGSFGVFCVVRVACRIVLNVPQLTCLTYYYWTSLRFVVLSVCVFGLVSIQCGILNVPHLFYKLIITPAICCQPSLLCGIYCSSCCELTPPF